MLTPKNNFLAQASIPGVPAHTLQLALINRWPEGRPEGEAGGRDWRKGDAGGKERLEGRRGWKERLEGRRGGREEQKEGGGRGRGRERSGRPLTKKRTPYIRYGEKKFTCSLYVGNAVARGPARI